MDIKIQIIVIAVIVIAMAILVNMIRNHKIELRYALLWMLMGFGVFIFTCFPGLIRVLAKMMGISEPVNMLFFVGFCFSLAIIFSLSVAISRLSNRAKKLTQEIALLKKEIKKD